MGLSILGIGESGPKQVSPEVAHYFRVVEVADRGMRRGLFNGLGRDVLDEIDRAAQNSTEVPSPNGALPNNVISFPTRPEIGAIAVSNEAAAPTSVTPNGPLPFEVSAPVPSVVPTPPAAVDALQAFPEVLRDAA